MTVRIEEVPPFFYERVMMMMEMLTTKDGAVQKEAHDIPVSTDGNTTM